MDTSEAKYCVDCSDPAVQRTMYKVSKHSRLLTLSLTYAIGALDHSVRSVSVLLLAKQLMWIMEVGSLTIGHTMERLTSIGQGCSGATPDCDIVLGAMSQCPASSFHLSPNSLAATPTTPDFGPAPNIVVHGVQSQHAPPPAVPISNGLPRME